MNYDIPDFLKRKPEQVNVGRELGTALAMLLAVFLWCAFLLML